MRIYKLANLLITPLLGLTLLAGCANLAPDYARPELPVPTMVSGGTASESADTKW
mgnify:CR=1 FL=1